MPGDLENVDTFFMADFMLRGITCYNCYNLTNNYCSVLKDYNVSKPHFFS